MSNENRQLKESDYLQNSSAYPSGCLKKKMYRQTYNTKNTTLGLLIPEA